MIKVIAVLLALKVIGCWKVIEYTDNASPLCFEVPFLVCPLNMTRVFRRPEALFVEKPV